MTKKGLKGLSLFFKAPEDLRTRQYKIGKRMLVEILTGREPRQTVLPPSVHPDRAHLRVGRGPVPAADLPVFDAARRRCSRKTLETLGWECRAGARPGYTQDGQRSRRARHHLARPERPRAAPTWRLGA
jgi:hypothetical protein